MLKLYLNIKILVSILILNILINEYTLLIFTADGSISSNNIFLIRVFNSLTILLPLFFRIIELNIIKIKQILYIFLNWYSLSAITIFSIITVFVVFNYLQVITYKIRDYNYKSDGSLAYIETSSIKNQPQEFLKKIYPEYNNEEILGALTSIRFSGHPKLEFISHPDNPKFYEIGIEGIRTSEFNKNFGLLDLNGKVWVFGGSTTFGAGVKSSETIPYYLNEIDKENVYINFAVPSYSQNQEIEKLILLLNKGYNPKRVIFIDGLNEVNNISSSNFHPIEQNTYMHSHYSYFYNYDSLVSNNRLNLKNLIYKTPIISRILESLDQRKTFTHKYDDHGYINVSSKNNLYHSDPWLSIVKTEDANISKLNKKLIRKLKLNNDFLYKLSTGFNFEIYSFLQPIGLLSTKNPFIMNLELYRENNPDYKLFKYIYPNIKKLITQKYFYSFYDLSDADKDCQNCYVDIAHYNKSLNKIIAKNILAVIKNKLN